MTFLDICSGIGGFRHGFETAGHQCIGFIEKDKHARKSYMAMYSTKKEWSAEDVTTIRAEAIPYADIWAFGFPCTDISVCGKRTGINGSRSRIFYDIIELVKSKKEVDKPRLLIAENVRNLLSVNHGWDFSSVLFEMDAAGYDAEWCLYNSKNYDVPQNRQRIFIVGVLRGYGRGKVLPVPRENASTIKRVVDGRQGERVYDTSANSITISANGGGWGANTGLYFIDMDKELQITDYARCIQSRYNKGASNRKGELSGVLEVSACLTPERENKRQAGRRYKTPEEPMFCLTAQDRHGVLLRDIESGQLRIRRLTPKECWRLQGFSDALFERAKYSGASDAQLYKQAGNAVTTTVAHEIGLNIKKIYW